MPKSPEKVGSISKIKNAAGAVWAQTARNAYYPLPAPEAFYSGDVEPVQFIGQLRDYYA